MFNLKVAVYYISFLTWSSNTVMRYVLFQNPLWWFQNMYLIMITWHFTVWSQTYKLYTLMWHGACPNNIWHLSTVEEVSTPNTCSWALSYWLHHGRNNMSWKIVPCALYLYLHIDSFCFLTICVWPMSRNSGDIFSWNIVTCAHECAGFPSILP